MPEISPASSLNSSMSVGGGSSDPEFVSQSIPKLFTRAEPNDLVIDFNLPKNAAKVLSFWLKEKNLFDKGNKISYFRTRHEEFLPFFVMDENLGYCTDVNSLLKILGIQTYVREDWRLFVDSSRRILSVCFYAMEISIHHCP